MQIEASNDFEVPYALSVLCGGLDRQIEHHLFPRLAPERLREIAPEVKALCEEHGVEYRTGTWPETLRAAFAWIAKLSKESGGGPLATSRAVIGAMA
jgi:linoleoyl-CoA desaturase